MRLSNRSTPAQDFVKSLISKNFPIQERFGKVTPLVHISPYHFFNLLVDLDKRTDDVSFIKIYQESTAKCNNQKKIIKRLEFYSNGIDSGSSELKNIEVCYKYHDKPIDLHRELVAILNEYGFDYRINDYNYRSKTYSLIANENVFYNILGIRLPELSKEQILIGFDDINFGTFFANSSCNAIEFQLGITSFVYLNGAINRIDSGVRLKSFAQLYQKIKDRKKLISVFG